MKKYILMLLVLIFSCSVSAQNGGVQGIGLTTHDLVVGFIADPIVDHEGCWNRPPPQPWHIKHADAWIDEDGVLIIEPCQSLELWRLSVSSDGPVKVRHVYAGESAVIGESGGNGGVYWFVQELPAGGVLVFDTPQQVNVEIYSKVGESHAD